VKLKFSKMQGAGNDFVVLDGVREPIALSAAQVRWLADRHFGVGADQILLVESTALPGVDFRYRIFNADGGEVEHCGNGARCFVKFVRDNGLTDARTIRVEVMKGVLTLTLREDGNVVVDMGVPQLDPALVPFDTSGLAGRPDGEGMLWPLDIGGRVKWLAVVSMGNPHAVQRVDDVAVYPVGIDGPLIDMHRRFPERVNAGFMQIVDRHTLRLRVFERGAGETLACGTGACAAAVVAIRAGLADSPVIVHTRGGPLSIEWDGRADPAARLTMAGPASTVFEGEIELADSPALPPGASPHLSLSSGTAVSHE
jgi:diaminopimelate epimerase